MSMKTVTSEQIAQALAGRVRGEVLTDDKTLGRNAVDQSIYEVRPLAVSRRVTLRMSPRSCALSAPSASR